MMINKNMNVKENEIGAIGIGAMIVFIALILVAAVASAVIIQTGEKLQQNAQQSGSDTQREISGKISVNAVIVYDAQHYLLYFETAPGSDPISTANVIWQMSCDDAGAYAYVSDDFFDGTIGEDQQPAIQDDLGTPAANAGVVTTLAPGVPYAIFLDANQAADCSAGSVGTNGKVTFWIHVEGGGSTYETLYISSTDVGLLVI